MTQRRGTRDVVWIGLLMGLFALLCINVAVGITKGYGKPPGGPLLVLLAAPGMVLGWGGVALLFVAIPYALLTWRHGRGPGSVLAVLGSLVFAIGVGGLAGVMTSPAAAAGGRLAGGLATLLRDGVGTGLAGLILAFVAVPGLLLALAPLLLEATGARAVTRAQGGRGPKAWYPERRLAPDGTELPPEFTGASDVGAIRVREPGDGPPPPPPPPTSTVTLSPPTAGPAVKKPKPIAGIRYADEPLPDVGGPPPDAPRETKDAALPSGVRYAAPETPPPAPAPDVEELVEFVETAGAAADDVGVPRERPAGREAPSAAPTPAPAALAAAAEPEPASLPPLPPPAPLAAPLAALTQAAPEPARNAPEAPVVASAPSPAPVVSAATVVNEATRSSSAYRRKLDATGLVDGGAPAPRTEARATALDAASPSPAAAAPVAPAARPAAPGKPRPAKPTRPRDLNEAIRGLFSSLPIEELPPVQPAIDPPEAPPPEPRIDPPGQRTLFDDAAVPRAAGQRHPGTNDALFAPSVEAALERGSASLVLLKRKLGVGYARAASLMEALVEEGILGEMTASGSRPTLITLAEWSQRKGR